MVYIPELHQPQKFAGQFVKVFLKTGGSFELKITETTKTHISGFDVNNLDLCIDCSDINFIVFAGVE
jgi:hypothetical protein